MPINYPNIAGGVSGDFATKQSNSFSGSQTITGSLIVSGSNVSLESNTRSQLKVIDERLDLIVTGSRPAGTQILLDAANNAGTSQIIAQAENNVVVQAGNPSSYPYYFHADADAKFVALEADDASATIYIGGTGYASSVNIGSAGSRVISVGNTGSFTQTILKGGDSIQLSSSLIALSGAFIFPKVTGDEKATLTAVIGMSVYQTNNSGSDSEGLYIYKSTGWIQII